MYKEDTNFTEAVISNIMGDSKPQLNETYNPKLYSLESEKTTYDPKHFERSNAGKIFRSKYETIPGQKLLCTPISQRGKIRSREEVPFRDYQSSFSYGSFHKNSTAQNAWLQEMLYQVIVDDKPKVTQSKQEVTAAMKEWLKQRWGTTRALLRDSTWSGHDENNMAESRIQGQGLSFDDWMKRYDRKRKAEAKRKRMENRRNRALSKNLKQDMERKLEEREKQWLQEKMIQKKVKNAQREKEKTKKLEREQFENSEKRVKAKEAMKQWLLRKQQESERKRQIERRKEKLKNEVREEERRRKWMKKGSVCAYSTSTHKG